MDTQTTNTITVSELEEFYYQACEDYHLWDESEKGAYPIKRILDAMGIFLKSKQTESKK